MRVAIVGGGISGLVCARLLHEMHEVSVFEAGARVGGHSNTVVVKHEGREIPVDTGFIVFNERNYPKFTALLGRLGVASQPAPMGFSVRCDRTGLEYGGSSAAGLLARPANLLRPGFYRMVRDIARLGGEGKALLEQMGEDATLADLCATGRFSREFLDYYLIPMGAAIWSAPRDAMLRFPARFFLRFFDNHGMLELRERPQWRTMTGGSWEYVRRLIEPFRDRIRLSSPVASVRRGPEGVEITSGGRTERFDHVILATHSDQSLAMLADPSEAEREVLGAMPYQPNLAVLHADPAVLPRRKKAWAAWNYRMGDEPAAPVAVTYNMTILQSLGTRAPLCVTLNDAKGIRPETVLGSFQYHHPVYTLEGLAARKRRGEICGVNRTHYCGAYWGNGFHEDGVVSALAVCGRFGVAL